MGEDDFIIPSSPLELQALTTVPEWKKLSGNNYLNKKLSNKMALTLPKGTKINVNGESVVLEDDVILADSNNLSMFSLLTQDWRLGNLTRPDMLYIERKLLLSANGIRHGFESSTIPLFKGAVRSELSQARNGFLRDNSNTITQKQERTLKEKKESSGFKLPWSK